MHDKFWLFTVVGKAALIVTTGCFVLVVCVKLAVTSSEQLVLGMIMVFLPTGIAAWWMFRKLQIRYTRGEARAVAIAFAVFTPVALVMGFFVAEITGGYAGFLGRPFGFAGAFAGIVVLTTFLSFVPSVLALWITRRIGSGQ